MPRQTLSQRKAIRSEAAKRGWQTRIARERREIEEANAAEERSIQEALERVRSEHISPPAFECAPIAPPEPEHGPREMTTHDLGCWWHRFHTDGVLETYITPSSPFVASPKASIWQRIKGFFR